MESGASNIFHPPSDVFILNPIFYLEFLLQNLGAGAKLIDIFMSRLNQLERRLRCIYECEGAK